MNRAGARPGSPSPRLLALALAWAVGSVSSLAHAQAPDPTPDVSLAPVGCDELDVQEAERLLRIELAVVAARAERPRAPSVTIACSDATLHIEISDPLSHAKRTLDLPAPARAPGRERTVALAASQLFLSSWLEMIVQVKPAAPEAPRAAPEKQPLREPPRLVAPHPHEELFVGGLLHLRDISQPFATLGPELRLSIVTPSRWLFGVQALSEFGSATRATGNIRLSTLDAGVHGGVRVGSGRWAFDTELSLGVALLHARGAPNAGHVQGSSAQGSALDAEVSAGPTLLLGHLVLKAVAEAGVTAPGVVLRVTGDAPVRVSGAWLGCALLVGLELGS